MPRSDFLLSPQQRADARVALRLLAPLGLTLEAAARLALDRQRAVSRILISDAADRFLLSRHRKVSRRGAPLRSATLTWYEQFLNPLVRDHGADAMDALTRTQFSQWIHALRVGETARTSIARAARALWRWALAQNPPHATEDITIGLAFSRGPLPESRRLVLTPAHAAAILASAGPKRSAYALMLFVGLRPEEIAGRAKPWLCWEHVNVAERWIRIPDTISKTGKPRLIEHLPATLWPWLTPGPLTTPVSPVSERTLRQFAQRAADLTAWPYDCFRHTAASYLINAIRDAGLVAEWIGHEGRPALLHQIYRGQLTLARTQVNHALAQSFLALAPPELAAPRARLLALLAQRPRRIGKPTTRLKPAR